MTVGVPSQGPQVTVGEGNVRGHLLQVTVGEGNVRGHLLQVKWEKVMSGATFYRCQCRR